MPGVQYLWLFDIWKFIFEAQEVHRHRMLSGVVLEYRGQKTLRRPVGRNGGIKMSAARSEFTYNSSLYKVTWGVRKHDQLSSRLQYSRNGKGHACSVGVCLNGTCVSQLFCVQITERITAIQAGVPVGKRTQAGKTRTGFPAPATAQRSAHAIANPSSTTLEGSSLQTLVDAIPSAPG